MLQGQQQNTLLSPPRMVHITQHIPEVKARETSTLGTKAREINTLEAKARETNTLEAKARETNTLDTKALEISIPETAESQAKRHLTVSKQGLTGLMRTTTAIIPFTAVMDIRLTSLIGLRGLHELKRKTMRSHLIIHITHRRGVILLSIRSIVTRTSLRTRRRPPAR
mgnify:CR=1 FL=1